MVLNDGVVGRSSEAESFGEAGAVDVLVDVLGINWVFDLFFDGEGGVAGGVEVAGLLVEGSFPGSPGLDFLDLNRW